jgi:hypothetical protein
VSVWCVRSSNLSASVCRYCYRHARESSQPKTRSMHGAACTTMLLKSERPRPFGFHLRTQPKMLYICKHDKHHHHPSCSCHCRCPAHETPRARTRRHPTNPSRAPPQAVSSPRCACRCEGTVVTRWSSHGNSSRACETHLRALDIRSEPKASSWLTTTRPSVVFLVLLGAGRS